MQTTYRSHPVLAKAVVPNSELSPEGSLLKQSLDPEGSHRVQIPRTSPAVEPVDVDSRWLLETAAARSLLLLEPTTHAFSPPRENTASSFHLRHHLPRPRKALPSNVPTGLPLHQPPTAPALGYHLCVSAQRPQRPPDGSLCVAGLLYS